MYVLFHDEEVAVLYVLVWKRKVGKWLLHQKFIELKIWSRPIVLFMVWWKVYHLLNKQGWWAVLSTIKGVGYKDSLLSRRVNQDEK